MIPGDGEVIEGVAAVNEAAITGESAPVIRESGGDRSAVTGGTRVLSDWLLVRISANPGESTLDRMIALVEGAKRQKTPNEVALDILLIGLTLIFLLVVVTLKPFALFAGGNLPLVFLVALLVTLIPTTIGGLLSAIGMAGMDRLVRLNVIAKSGRAVEAAGDVDVLLLDKTGTITFGNRRCSALYAAPGVSGKELAEGALLASLADDTPEGKSIVEYLRILHPIEEPRREELTPIAFSAETRLSGVDWNGQVYRKGAVDAALRFIDLPREKMPEVLSREVDKIAQSGGTPLLVVANGRLLGAIHLKDVVKPGIRERFAELRRMGIRTVMVTGDNPLTAAAIAAEAGVDDVIAEATPEKKLARIRQEQGEGRLVAMCGDGTNDAPALAQADVGSGHERRHPGRPRGGQHGRPGQRPDQAARGGPGRQGDADDPRRADHLLHRQRRGQVLRHPAGAVRRHLPAAGRAQRDAPAKPAERDPVGHRVQRADHRRADPAGLARRAGSGGGRFATAAAQPADLWRRRPGGAVPRDQGDRPAADRRRPGMNNGPRRRARAWD